MKKEIGKFNDYCEKNGVCFMHLKSCFVYYISVNSSAISKSDNTLVIGVVIHVVTYICI